MFSFKIDFFSNTDDIFDQKTIRNLDNSSLFVFREVIAPYFGKCYTTCSLINLTLNDCFNFGLKSNWNYKFYMHAQDEEIWLGGTGMFVSDAVAITLSKIFNNDHPKDLNCSCKFV